MFQCLRLSIHFVTQVIIRIDLSSEKGPNMLRLALVGWLVAGMFFVPGWAAGNWPQFRGPSADGTSDAIGLPTEWSESKNVKWKAPLHDKGWSSPVVWGSQIWVTAATEDGSKDYAICVDKNSGKIIHDIHLWD